MTQPDTSERRLAAILSADVAGYSRLMGADEAGTLGRLKAHRRELVDPSLAAHRGRIVKTTGDGMLVEFPSVVDAVACAIAIQEGMRARNAGIVADQRIDLRIGVNLGDVIVDDGDIFGDGVNLAARLQELAQPGGVLVSEDVRRHVGNRVACQFADIGERALKNINRTVRVFEILTDPGMTPSPVEPALRDRPSIAVLPFDNLSGDPEQAYFADGIVEDITAALSRVRSFAVIARHSTLVYRGRAINAQQVGRELGVRYLLEGAVRRAGRRVRITVQLIDAASGAHLWADRHDGELADIFDLQDRITERVVGAVQPSIRAAEIERARRKRPDSLDAYDLTMRALPDVWLLDRDANARATPLLDAALRHDPNYPLALALKAWAHGQRVTYNWSTQPDEDRNEALRLASRAAELAADDSFVLTVLGNTHTLVRDLDKAAVLLEQALAVDPNSAWAWNRSGWLEAYLGRSEAAIERFEHAIRLSPFDPMNFNCFLGIGTAHFVAGRYAEAASWHEKGLLANPKAVWIYRTLIASYVHLGRMDDAHAGLARLLEAYPNLTIATVSAGRPFNSEVMDRTLEGLRRVGLPEG